MTDSQEEDSLIVPAPGVGGRQARARRPLECQTSHTTLMSGQSASRLGKLNSTNSLKNQQTKKSANPNSIVINLHHKANFKSRLRKDLISLAKQCILMTFTTS